MAGIGPAILSFAGTPPLHPRSPAHSPWPLMPNRIEDYALIGDCETAALVSRTGSIDWLCWPRFDSGAVFAAMLGEPGNGHWSITPEQPGFEVTRRYRGRTLLLETEYRTPDGTAVLTDFMPLRTNGSSHVVRIVLARRLPFNFALRVDDGCMPLVHAEDAIGGRWFDSIVSRA